MTDSIHLPTIKVATTTGDMTLSDLTGLVIIYFYPKDLTSGCTVQAKDFSCLKDDFDALEVKIFGVSRDTLKKHQQFIEKENLTIPLISDESELLCQHFDVIKEKNMYGKKVLGIERSTFIFRDGKLLQAYRKVKSAGHAQFILEQIQHLLKDTSSTLN